MKLDFSVIVPVFNRPDEVEELLESLSRQTDRDFEVVVVEDGSTVPCAEVCQRYASVLNLRYFFKPNSGRSDTRNYGMERAFGNYFIIYDSDCIIPPDYFAVVREALENDYADCYGGPDAADSSFSPMQKAINYSMTSFFTTGGIRGGMKKKGKFSPRSFNMGISREVFETVGGYKNMIGEDIDLSLRIRQVGFRTTLIPEARVYHKRRVNLKKFFKQVNTFGKGRILLHHLHKGSLKIIHLLPMFFVLGNLLLVLLAILFRSPLFLIPIFLYVLLLFIDSWIKNGKVKIALLSILTAYTQLFGYGLGLLEELLTGKAGKRKQEELYK